MNLRLPLRSLPSCLFILRSAACLVPGQERAEWLAEWQGELWHVWHACDSKSLDRFRGSPVVTDFCLGAFRDAFWLGWNNPRSTRRRVFRSGSASRCSVTLALWTALSLLICFSLPSVRSTISPSPYSNAEGLVMISSGGYAGSQSPSIQLQDYQSRVHGTCSRHLLSMNHCADEYTLPGTAAQNFRLGGQATTFSNCSTRRYLRLFRTGQTVTSLRGSTLAREPGASPSAAIPTWSEPLPR
jgi:hypothetical protein